MEEKKGKAIIPIITGNRKKRDNIALSSIYKQRVPGVVKAAMRQPKNSFSFAPRNIIMNEVTPTRLEYFPIKAM